VNLVVFNQLALNGRTFNKVALLIHNNQAGT
jgi:hypothetical protein